jgi:hypothetical protein
MGGEDLVSEDLVGEALVGEIMMGEAMLAVGELDGLRVIFVPMGVSRRRRVFLCDST